MKRVSKNKWLKKALELLDTEGVESMRVERLARELGVSKSGFYWHFKNRYDFRAQVVELWAHEYTEVVISTLSHSEGTPRERLERVAEMILEHKLTRYELSMRAWAAQEPSIARLVRQVYQRRLKTVRGLFVDMGFDEEEAEVRARLFACYHTWECAMFYRDSRSIRRDLITLGLNLLTSRPARRKTSCR